MERVNPVVLTIGTTHPLNIAGLGLCARVAHALGIRVVTIVAGVSAQSATRVLARSALDPVTIAAQFEALRNVPIDAVHIGALLDARSVLAIAAGLGRFERTPIICDPVIAATGGDRLATDETIAALRGSLFAQCSLVTPNLDEAALLLNRPIADVADMEAAARSLLATGTRAVLVKGGHLASDATDILADESGVVRFVTPRLDAALRGTGDLLACAIAARRAGGDSLVDSITAARAFVHRCLAENIGFAGARTVR